MQFIALNGRFSGTPQPTGTQTAAYQLFDAIVREPRQVELVVFADSRFKGVAEWKDIPGLRFVETPFQDWSRGRAHRWEQLELPIAARRMGCDIVHHPITTNSLWHNGCKSVVTLHDLNFYRHPEWYSRAFRLVFAVCAVPGLKRANRVVTISNYVRDQAHEVFRIPGNRLRMIYNGVKAMKVSPPSSDNIPPHVLCVGSLQPHKNLVRTIKAYLAVRNEFPGLELHIVGRPQAQFTAESELPQLLNAEGVRLLGYLSEEDLGRAYKEASVFCYPSLEEGFGLPVLEAMTVGSLVITSNVSCLPEVSGPAAFYVDPYSVDAMADGIRKVLQLTPQEHAEKVEEGRRWAQRFTWQNAARDYLKVYAELA